MTYRPNLRISIERLLKIERRVRDVYLALGERPEFPTELRTVWHDMAKEEEHHGIFLARSAGLLNFVDSPLEIPEATLVEVEVQVTAAEAAARQVALNIDEACRQALILEDAARRSLVDTWVQGFSPSLESLLHATKPEKEACLRRLIEAVQIFSTNQALRNQAAVVWSTYQHQKPGRGKEGMTPGG